MKTLKLKLKNYQDVFKAWILSKQKFYQTIEMKNLTAVKSNQEEQDEIIIKMYQKPDDSGFVLNDHQRSILENFSACIA